MDVRAFVLDGFDDEFYIFLHLASFLFKQFQYFLRFAMVKMSLHIISVLLYTLH